MKLSQDTIKKLAEIISGTYYDDYFGYRNPDEVVDFFKKIEPVKPKKGTFEEMSDPVHLLQNRFDMDDGIEEYTINRLEKYNKTKNMFEIVKRALSTSYFNYHYPIEQIIGSVYQNVKEDGYQFICERDDSDNLIITDIIKFTENSVDSPSVDEIEEIIISEHLDKVKQKLNDEDYSGAISSARTFIEETLKKIINDPKIADECKGDVGKLYKKAKEKIDLDPSDEKITDEEKQILSGLISLTNGIGGLSNKMGDRHANDYDTQRRHARLAMNTAITFSDFIMATYMDRQGEFLAKVNNAE